MQAYEVSDTAVLGDIAAFRAALVTGQTDKDVVVDNRVRSDGKCTQILGELTLNLTYLMGHL